MLFANSALVRHHQHLYRKCQCQCIQRHLSVFSHIGYESTVHNIIDCLQHHRQHHRHSHRQHQLIDRHCPHPVLCFFLFHNKPPVYYLGVFSGKLPQPKSCMIAPKKVQTHQSGFTPLATRLSIILSHFLSVCKPPNAFLVKLPCVNCMTFVDYDL